MTAGSNLGPFDGQEKRSSTTELNASSRYIVLDIADIADIADIPSSVSSLWPVTGV